MSREIDAKVAEKVMGEKVVVASPDMQQHYEGGHVCYREVIIDGEPGYIAVPYYTLVASDDYEVLKHVREKWGWTHRADFGGALWQMWGQRANCDSPSWSLRYEPGDYAIAALKALGEAVD